MVNIIGLISETVLKVDPKGVVSNKNAYIILKNDHKFMVIFLYYTFCFEYNMVG